MNFYSRHIGDYLKDTAHLSLLEHGIYARLMDVYYTREAGIPESQAARLIGARTPEEVAAVHAVLAEFFQLVDGVWVQERCEQEISAYADKCAKAKDSARSSWSSRGKQSERNADAMQPHSERIADAERTHSERNAKALHTQSQSHTQCSVPNGTGVPPEPGEQIFGLGVPLLTAANVTERNARSMLGLMRKTHGDAAVLDALQRCAEAKPLEPVAWLQAALKRAPPRSAESARDRAARERMEAFAPSAAVKVGKVAEVIDVVARRLG